MGKPAAALTPDVLTAALALTGKATPTPAELSATLCELYPAGNGPTVADVLAAGLLVPTIDKQGLRLPPPTPAELWGRQLIPPPAPPAPPAAPLFSYYRGGIATTTPHAAITPGQLHAVLTSPQHRAQTEALRAAPVGSPSGQN